MVTQINTADLDFDQIKASLKSYLQTQNEFADWNFDGSGLNIILDLLAHNTHYNAILAHLSVNESFLDSAQLRPNIVGHAKLLGYIPTSTKGSVATVDILVNYPTGTYIPNSLVLNSGTRINSTIDGIQYPFIIPQSITSTTKTIGAPNDTFLFSSVEIKQGTVEKVVFRVDNRVPNQKFIIPDADVDISSVLVKVKPYDGSTSFVSYSGYQTISSINQTSTIFYVQENADGRYEIYFGNGSIGANPPSNSIVEIEYSRALGSITNGISLFSYSDSVPIPSSIVSVNLSTLGFASSLGKEKESMESIRYNAPLSFVAQNRAVTADDYKALVIQLFSTGSTVIKDVSVWGGEDNLPPDFGKVFISLTKNDGTLLNNNEKLDLVTRIKKKNVVAVTPVITDPDSTRLKLNISYKFNPNVTTFSGNELNTLVRNSINLYDSNNLSKFDGVFRYSQVLSSIDNTDVSILNSSMKVTMFKNISLTGGVINSMITVFASPLNIPNTNISIISSTAFQIGGIDHFFADEPIVNDSINRNVYAYKVVGGTNVRVLNNVGNSVPSTGEVQLNSFVPDSSITIKLFASADSYDIAPKRNQLISIDNGELLVSGEIDTIATTGINGTINYTTTKKG